MASDPIDEQLARIRTKSDARAHTFCYCSAREDVERFERDHGVVLPEGYRRFILEVGNGGDMFNRLGSVPNDLSPEEKRSCFELPDLAKPFPFTEPWVWEGEPYDGPKRATARYGSLNLGTEGCGEYWLLIVSGAERGNVWSYASVGVVPLQPKRSFLDWVEAWLDGVTQ